MLRGIQKNGKDLTVMDYTREILDVIKKKVKAIPPFKRRVVDMMFILGNQKNETTKSPHCICGENAKGQR